MEKVYTVSCNGGSCCIDVWKAGNYVILRGTGESTGEIMMTVREWEILKKDIIDGKV
jgi:hypothetical protein